MLVRETQELKKICNTYMHHKFLHTYRGVLEIGQSANKCKS